MCTNFPPLIKINGVVFFSDRLSLYSRNIGKYDCPRNSTPEPRLKRWNLFCAKLAIMLKLKAASYLLLCAPASTPASREIILLLYFRVSDIADSLRYFSISEL